MINYIPTEKGVYSVQTEFSIHTNLLGRELSMKKRLNLRHEHLLTHTQVRHVPSSSIIKTYFHDFISMTIKKQPVDNELKVVSSRPIYQRAKNFPFVTRTVLINTI